MVPVNLVPGHPGCPENPETVVVNGVARNDGPGRSLQKGQPDPITHNQVTDDLGMGTGAHPTALREPERKHFSMVGEEPSQTTRPPVMTQFLRKE